MLSPAPPPASAETLALLFGTSTDNLTESLLDALPIGVYVCDRAGRLVRYNRAAAELWGRAPALGERGPLFCGSYRLHSLDGQPVPHAQCPMAAVLADGESRRDQEIVVERPDHSRIVALVNIAPFKNADGEVIGAVNVFRDNSEQRHRHATLSEQERLDTILQALPAAIVESSEDAIIAKTLDGVIQSWNPGAEQIFGYTAKETVGQSILMLVPEDRRDEVTAILERIRRGERVEHHETVRRCKDGRLLNISLSVSPIKAADGSVIGASKIARDVTQRVQAIEQQQLLLREMNHRVKNLITLSSGLVSLSARHAGSVEELADDVQQRFAALARAHELILPRAGDIEGGTPPGNTLQALARTVILPHDHGLQHAPPRITISGDDVPLSGRAATSFALLFHEFATNAAKYGAFSRSDGSVAVTCTAEGDLFVVEWREHGGPAVENPGARPGGFGDQLSRATIEGQLRGRITRQWEPEGLIIRLEVPLEHLGV